MTATVTQEPVLLRDSEVAAIMDVSKTKAYLLMASGEVPGVIRIGKSIRVHKPTLLAWLESRAKDGTTA